MVRFITGKAAHDARGNMQGEGHMKCGNEEGDPGAYFDDVRGEFVRLDDNRSRIVFDAEPDDDVWVLPELEDVDAELDEAGEDEERGQK